ncbi:LysR family transcriptional regulator [Caenimonas sedimenti]|nr:LysR family transcriptional regulator [Caenimonas sedimenti]
MDIKQLRYAIAVAEAGSFSAGARQAFVTQPTLSAAIAALEADVGFKVFDRHPRGVVLTPQGSRLIAHARSVLSELAAMKTLARSPAVQRRRLRVGLLATLAPQFVADTIAALTRSAGLPGCQTEDGSLSALRRRLASGRLDAILTSLEAQPAPGVCQLELAADSQVLALPEAWEVPAQVTPAMLHGQTLIVRIHCEFLQAASRILDECRVAPIVVARTESDAHAMAMVGAGLGACLVPDSLSAPRVKLVQVQQVRLQRRLGLEWIKGAAGGALDRMQRLA